MSNSGQKSPQINHMGYFYTLKQSVSKEKHSEKEESLVNTQDFSMTTTVSLKGNKDGGITGLGYIS